MDHGTPFATVVTPIRRSHEIKSVRNRTGFNHNKLTDSDLVSLRCRLEMGCGMPVPFADRFSRTPFFLLKEMDILPAVIDANWKCFEFPAFPRG